MPLPSAIVSTFLIEPTVDVRFGGKIDDGAGLVLGQELGDEVEITDVALDENMPGITVDRSEVLQVAGVGQRIEIDDFFVRLSQPVEDKIAADETGAAGNEDHCVLQTRQEIAAQDKTIVFNIFRIQVLWADASVLFKRSSATEILSRNASKAAR